MGKLPAFQFYPGDWMSNVKLRRCSHAARGAWIDVLCILHDSDEYGLIRWPLADIAQATNTPLKLLRELVDKEVLKGSDQGAEAFIYTPRHARRDGKPVILIEATTKPVWFSSRLVKDAYLRRVKGASSRFDTGGNRPPKGAPKGGIGEGFGERQGDGSSSSSSSSSPPNPQGVGEWGEIKIPEELQRSKAFMEALANFRGVQAYHGRFNPISFEQTIQMLSEYPIRRATAYLRYWVGINRFQPKWDSGYEAYLPPEEALEHSSVPKSYAPKIKLSEAAS